MNNAVGPSLAALAYHAVLLGVYIAARGGDPAALVCVGSEWAPAPAYQGLPATEGRDGYDGQFYYAIARAPLRPQWEGIDRPAFRHARIVYPLASWLFSAGQPQLLVWAMPAVNLLAAAVLAALGAVTAARYGLSPWLGFLLPLAANAALPALRDLTDAVSSCAVAALLAAWILGWHPATLAGVAAAAAFSREQNLAFILVVLLAAAYRRDGRRVLGLALALLAWVGWAVFLRSVYGEWPFAAGGKNFSAPGAGLLFRLTHLVSGRWDSAAVNLLATGSLIVATGLALVLVPSRASRVLRLVALAGAASVVVAGVPIYEDWWSYGRVFAALPVACWLACVQLRRPRAAAALSAAALMPVLVVARACFRAAGAPV